MRGLLLTTGTHHWAVALDDVQEVLAMPPLTPLPRSPVALLGVCNRRGDIVPVVALATVLGVGGSVSAPWMVVVDTDFGPAGLAVDAVPSSIELGEPVASGDSPDVVSVHRVDSGGRPLAVARIDVGRVLTPERLGPAA